MITKHAIFYKLVHYKHSLIFNHSSSHFLLNDVRPSDLYKMFKEKMRIISRWKVITMLMYRLKLLVHIYYKNLKKSVILYQKNWHKKLKLPFVMSMKPINRKKSKRCLINIHNMTTFWIVINGRIEMFRYCAHQTKKHAFRNSQISFLPKLKILTKFCYLKKYNNLYYDYKVSVK